MTYSQDIARVKAGIDNLAANSLRVVALEAHRQVTQQTPVGNPSTWKSTAPKGYVGGQARSNWFMNIGAAHSTSTDTSFANISAAETTAQSIQPDNEIHITNNLSYIERLNDGWSRQAPANFVQSAVQGAKAKITDLINRGLK
jgi:hypothetical protein